MPVVTFVPSTSSRARDRGFDHAQMISSELAICRERHHARLQIWKSQVRQLGASREQRKSQLKGIFRPKNQYLFKIGTFCWYMML
jgi:predicted amidophosphoribosyltransferase